MRYTLPLLMILIGGAIGRGGDTPVNTSGYCGQVACYAKPSNTPAFTGYFVGGGQAFCGTCRRPDEGTWGWDYQGLCFPHIVILRWNHGTRYQGGGGPYKVDGPHVPNAPALLNPNIYGRKQGEE